MKIQKTVSNKVAFFMNIIRKIQLSILKFYILGYDLKKKCSPHEVPTFF